MKRLLIILCLLPFFVEGQSLLRKEQIEPLVIDTTANDINRSNWETYIERLAGSADLSGYVTTNTTQSVIAEKTFTVDPVVSSTSPHFVSKYTGAGVGGGLQIWDNTPQIVFDFGFNNTADEGYIWSSQAYDLKIGLGNAELFRFKNNRAFLLSEASVVPATPAVGFGGLYVKTDGKIYFKNDGGTEFDLTSSGGSYSGGAGVNISSNIISLDIWSLSTITGFNSAPYLPVYDGVNLNSKMAVSNFDADYFGSGNATNGYKLTADGSGGTSWEPDGGGGDVYKVGTPANNQVGVWTGDGTLEGDSDFTFDGTNLTVTGNVTSDQNRVQTALTNPSTFNFSSGAKAKITLTTSVSDMPITNLPDGGEGTLEVYQDASGGNTFTIAGSTGYTTLKQMGSNNGVDTGANAHTTVVYWRTGDTLYYGFILDN